MRKAILIGATCALLALTAYFLFTTAWPSCYFVLTHFLEIIAGEVVIPEIPKKVIACLCVVPVLIIFLIQLIPMRHEGDKDDD